MRIYEIDYNFDDETEEMKQGKHRCSLIITYFKGEPIDLDLQSEDLGRINSTLGEWGLTDDDICFYYEVKDQWEQKMDDEISDVEKSLGIKIFDYYDLTDTYDPYLIEEREKMNKEIERMNS